MFADRFMQGQQWGMRTVVNLYVHWTSHRKLFMYCRLLLAIVNGNGVRPTEARKGAGYEFYEFRREK